jgi:hypothetical protein
VATNISVPVPLNTKVQRGAAPLEKTFGESELGYALSFQKVRVLTPESSAAHGFHTAGRVAPSNAAGGDQGPSAATPSANEIVHDPFAKAAKPFDTSDQAESSVAQPDGGAG